MSCRRRAAERQIEGEAAQVRVGEQHGGRQGRRGAAHIQQAARRAEAEDVAQCGGDIVDEGRI
jgi:hypothetical protein